MPPKNPMTEGEALAVLDVDAIASSLVDWMLTKAMPNGDLLHASVACDYAGMANFKRALSKQLRAALREQPEARGGVDDAMVERARQAYKAKKRWSTGECPEGPIRSVADLNRNDDDAWRAALTAAQQPVQEGGGEVATARRLAVGLWQRHYREVAPQWEPCPDLAGLLSQIDNMASGLRRFDDTAPPSAPVGVEAAARRLLEAYDGNAHPFEAAAAAQAMREALAQQPAQAAPGDGRHRYEQSGEHGGCSVCGYPSHERLLHTSPGDDAAGGGS